jgi:hypothetical protein
MTQTIQLEKIRKTAIHKFAVITLRGNESGVSYFPTLKEAETWAIRVKTTYGSPAVVDIAKLVSSATIDLKF